MFCVLDTWFGLLEQRGNFILNEQKNQTFLEINDPLVHHSKLPAHNPIFLQSHNPFVYYFL